MKRVFALKGRLTDSQPNQWYDGYPWLKGELVLYLGEIDNMRGHGVYAREDGKVYYGYHINDFLEYPHPHDEDYDEIEESVGLVVDPVDNKKYLCLSKKYFDIMEEADEAGRDEEEKINRSLVLRPTLEAMLKAPHMYARDASGFEDAFMIMVGILDSKFVHQEFPLLKNKHGVLSSMGLASKYDFSTSPSIVDLMKEVFDDLKERESIY